MAVFKLDSTSWESLHFDEAIWNLKEAPKCTADFLTNLSPAVVRITSLSENKDFSWFYGKFVSSKGQLKLSYPEVIGGTDVENIGQVLEIPNYCFSYYPFLKVEVEGKRFKGWYNYDTGELLQKEKELIISETDFADVVTFEARF